MAKRYIAYFRVSTQRQGQSGLGLEAQERAVLDYLNGGQWELIDSFTEIESGKNSSRPILADAIKASKQHKAILVIAKLDRLARNVAFIANLMESKIDFVATDRPNASPFELHIFAAMAEEETRQISQRTKAALQAAKARGVKLGNPTKIRNVKGAHEAVQRQSDLNAAKVYPHIKVARADGITSLNGLARYLTLNEIPTARGKLNWTPTGVRNLVARIEAPA
ncbi:MAG: recombinase family protein [Alphaproteobacteria bacterium]|nr:recombinase family protein [Alphaproteobacteria bacterium]